MSLNRSTIRKLHAKRKKSYQTVFELKVDAGRQTTDNSALEKLHCLLAGGAKNKYSYVVVRIKPVSDIFLHEGPGGRI